MKLVLKLIAHALLILVIAHFLPGVKVATFWTAVIVSIFLGIVNVFIKPILVILTLPITIVTLGLFYFVINGLLVLLVASFLRGFQVDGLLTAMLFSIILSLANSLVNKFID